MNLFNQLLFSPLTVFSVKLCEFCIVLAEYDLKHASSYSTEKFVVFSHSYGKKYSPQDIVSTEMYQNFQKLQPFKLFVKQGGGKYRHLTLSKLEDYLTIYFKKRSPIIFPPIYDDSAPHSTIKSIINLLEESFLHMKKDFCVIIPDFNYYEAMDVMEMDYAQFGLKPGAFASNGIIVFDLDLHLVLSARICSGNSINDIKDSMELMHADTKSLILLCKDFIGKNHLTVYGTIAFPEMSRVKLEDALFCEFCKSDIHFITEDDLQDKNHLAEWWVKMCDSLKDDDMMEDDFSSNREWFSKIPSQLMVVIARERDDLPVLFGNDDKRIRSLLLNPDQVKAIHYPAKKKIIRGSLLGHNFVEFNAVKNMEEVNLLNNFENFHRNHPNLVSLISLELLL